MRVALIAAAFAVASLLPLSAVAQDRQPPVDEEGVERPRVVEVELTERGPIPSVIKLAHNELIELRLTRKSEGACGMLLIEARDEAIALPVGTTVTHLFRAHERGGRVPFECGMVGYFLIE